MIREFLDIAASVGLDVLVEAHDESEVESALNAGAEIIGVNNRNLKDFSVDLQNSLRLRSLVPRDKIFVFTVDGSYILQCIHHSVHCSRAYTTVLLGRLIINLLAGRTLFPEYYVKEYHSLSGYPASHFPESADNDLFLHLCTLDTCIIYTLLVRL